MWTGYRGEQLAWLCSKVSKSADRLSARVATVFLMVTPQVCRRVENEPRTYPPCDFEDIISEM